MSNSESSAPAFNNPRPTARTFESSPSQLTQHNQAFYGNIDQPGLNGELAPANSGSTVHQGNGLIISPTLFNASITVYPNASHSTWYSHASLQNGIVGPPYPQGLHESVILDNNPYYRTTIVNHESPENAHGGYYNEFYFNQRPSHQRYGGQIFIVDDSTQPSASDYQFYFNQNTLSARRQLPPQQTIYNLPEQQQSVTTQSRSNNPTISPVLQGEESASYLGTQSIPRNNMELHHGRHAPQLSMPESVSHSASLIATTASPQNVSAVNPRFLSSTLHRDSVYSTSGSPRVSQSQNHSDNTLNSGPASNTLVISQRPNPSSRRRRRDNDDCSSIDEGPRPQKKRQPFCNQKLREDTATTRRMGACIRCNRQCIRCEINPLNPLGSCLPCMNSQKRIVFLPCSRLKISAASLFREGATPSFTWTTRLEGAEMTGFPLSAMDVKQLMLTQDRGEAKMTISVRRYIPQDTDKQSYSWSTSSGQNTVECPPYAISDTAQLAKTFKDYISLEHNLEKYFRDVEGTHMIISNVFNQALYRIKHSGDEEEKELLSDTVKLFVTSRFIERPWRISGTETLGMPAEIDPYLQQERVPVTPVMDNQLDQIVIRYILKPLSASIQRRLQKISKTMKRKSWFGVFLCSALLLSNYELATAHDVRFAKRYGLQGYSNPALVERFRLGAETVLYHYHYTCNGSKPFDLDWETPNEDTAAAELDAESLRFMVNFTKSIRSQSPYFQKLKARGRLEGSMYLVSQLFSSEWKPKDLVRRVVG